MISNTDIFLMNKALALAGRGEGKTFPNPMAGAVVSKRNKIIGEGWHRGSGEKHAEAIAIESAGGETPGATLYTNLEPCSHFGKTPPCADKIIKAGITRVVCAMGDPDPRVSGKGLRKLRGAGIEVVLGVLIKKAEELNEAYIINKTQNRPYVTLKSAMTLDGKIAAGSGLSRWITSKSSREFVHKLRAKNDAVITGIGTVLADNPRLSARTGKQSAQPYKIIVDSSARIASGSAVFRTNPEKVIVASAVSSARLEKKGIPVIKCPDDNGRVNLPALLKELLNHSISRVLVEAGEEINASFLENKLVDRVYFFYAPKIFGGRKAPGSFGGKGVSAPSEAVKIGNIKFRRFEKDFLIEGVPEY